VLESGSVASASEKPWPAQLLHIAFMRVVMAGMDDKVSQLDSIFKLCSQNYNHGNEKKILIAAISVRSFKVPASRMQQLKRNMLVRTMCLRTCHQQSVKAP
jgi:hypothetical protein